MPHEREILKQVLTCAAIGSPLVVRKWLEAFIARTGANELMINSQIFSRSARLRSYAIAADVRDALESYATRPHRGLAQTKYSPSP